MSIISLPDGRTISVPDNPDQEYKNRLQNKLAQDFPDYYSPVNERTLFGIGEEGLGGFGEVVKGIPRGLGVTALSGLEGIAQFFDEGNDAAITEALGSAKDYVSELDFLKPKEGYEDALSTKFGQGLGSLGAFVGAGFAGPLTLGGLAIGSGISQQADNIERTRAEGKEVSGTQEFFSELGGGVIGASEIFVPRLLGQMLSGVPKGQGGKLVNFFRRTETKKINGKDVEVPSQGVSDYFIGGAKIGALEGTQELSASIAQNLISRGVYDADIPISESALDELTVGGMVGFASDSIIRAISRKGLVTKYNEEKAKKADEKLRSQDDIAIENARIAAEQGDREATEADLDSRIDPTTGLPRNIDRQPALLPRYEFNDYKLQSNIGNNLSIEDSNIDDILSMREAILNNINNKNLSQEEISKLQKDLYAINQQLDKSGEANSRIIHRVPVIQNYNLQLNPLDDTVTIVGEQDGISYGTFSNQEEAAQESANLYDKNTERFLIAQAEQSASINGLLGNGTAEYIGRYVFDPFQHSIPAKAVANADEKIGIDRQKQAKLEEEVIRQEAEVLGSQEGQQVSVNELYMPEQQEDLAGKTTT